MVSYTQMIMVLHLKVFKNKVGDHSRGQPEAYLFDSYYTEV